MKKILMLLVFSMLTLFGQAYAMGISEYKAGDYKIYFLSENQMTGNTGILLNAKPEEIKKIFSEKTFPMYLKTFLVVGPKQTILVDGGFGNQLFKHLATLKISTNDIDHILLTHMHGDHIGGLLKNDKVAFPKATLWLAKQEQAYWTDKKIQNALPKDKQQGFTSAQKLLSAYANKVRTFSPNPINMPKEDLVDGIQPIAIFGHTPGHTGFIIGEGADALLIWADLVHVEKIQLAMPEVAVVFDVNPKLAVKTRLELMDYVAKNNIKFTGMHLKDNKALKLKKLGNSYEFVQ